LVRLRENGGGKIHAIRFSSTCPLRNHVNHRNRSHPQVQCFGGGVGRRLLMDGNTVVDSTIRPASWYRTQDQKRTFCHYFRRKSTKAVRFFNSAVMAPDTLNSGWVAEAYKTGGWRPCQTIDKISDMKKQNPDSTHC
jgi:hypothetical protein